MTRYAIRWREDASGFVGPHAGKMASKTHFATREAAEEVLRGMPNGAHAEVVELSGADLVRDWTLDDDARIRIDAELARIDEKQAGSPTCVVCGQRCTRLDKSGCCSKTSPTHTEHRAEVKSGVRA